MITDTDFSWDTASQLFGVFHVHAACVFMYLNIYCIYVFLGE